MKKSNNKKNLEKNLAKREEKRRKRVPGLAQTQKDLRKNSKVVPSKVLTKAMFRGGPTKSSDMVPYLRAWSDDSVLSDWGRILSQPFRHEGIFCPISYNPAPSFIQSTARTTYTDLNVQVGVTSTKQYVFYPGHGPMIQANQSTGVDISGMDGVSYHGSDLTINAGRYVIGPMTKVDSTGTHGAVAGVITGSVALNQSEPLTNTANSAPIPWDVNLPYVSETGSSLAGHHSRWQLVAMGLRVRQTTAELYRAGTIVTVQPNNVMTPQNLSQSKLEVYPTFQDWGPDVCQLSWIPRGPDMAFWHGQDNSGGVPARLDCRGGGILLFLNNPTGNILSYSIELVCHWQLAGTYLNAVGRQGNHAPEAKPAVEKALSHLQNSLPSADAAHEMFKKAAEHSGFGSPGDFAEKAAAVIKKYVPRLAATAAAA